MIIKHNEPLSSHTTYQIGGLCSTMLFPCDQADFFTIPDIIGRQPYLILSGGANILFGDDSFSAVFINMSEWKGVDFIKTEDGHSGATAIESRDHPSRHLQVKSGTRISELISFVRKQDIGGYEFLAGIPGCLGGAVFMNAGAWGRSISEQILSVEIFNLFDHKFRKLPPEQLDFSYRKQTFVKAGDIVTSVELDASNVDPDAGDKIRDIISKRKAKHPTEPSCGSVFKNPEDRPAGQLIEECGLKGIKQGGAQIAEKHGNFIINLGDASFDDVYQLIQKAQSEVEKCYEIKLEPEVRIIQSVDHPLFHKLT